MTFKDLKDRDKFFISDKKDSPLYTKIKTSILYESLKTGKNMEVNAFYKCLTGIRGLKKTVFCNIPDKARVILY